MTLGGLAYANDALHAGSKPDVELVMSPPAQSAARGATATFSVDIRRMRDFTAPMRLTVAALPRGVRARWRLADGAVTGVPPRVQDGAALTLLISRTARLGRGRLTIRATGGGHSVRRSLWLTVTRPLTRSFTLKVTPVRQVVARGSDARYRVRVSRTGGFRGRVALRVLDVADGERATFRPGFLVVTTSTRSQTATHRLVLIATGWVRGRRVRRHAVVTLAPVAARRFTVRGDLAAPLSPGVGGPLDLTLINPNAFGVRIRTLGVRLRATTTKRNCRADSQYSVRQYTGRYPLVLPPGRARLSTLVREASLWPRIAMRNLRSNQDACKGAVVRLDYTGVATR